MLQSILELLFPRHCYACRESLTDHEKGLCSYCRHRLPVTHFHHWPENPVKTLFYGRLQLESAAALFYFTKGGVVQQLMHNLKYRGQEAIGHHLGEWLGKELARCNGFMTVDLVVPVPLHPKKQRHRGYNQVDRFGRVIAQYLEAEFDPGLLGKVRDARTQVFKTRSERWSRKTERFTRLKEKDLRGLHVLLVDDIITTGATLEACADQLNLPESASLSIAVMAMA